MTNKKIIAGLNHQSSDCNGTSANKKIIKEFEKQLDGQWKTTSHYIVWGGWVKSMVRNVLKSQRREIIEKIEKLYLKDLPTGLGYTLYGHNKAIKKVLNIIKK